MNNKSVSPSEKRVFAGNVFGVSAVEFTWGLGLPLVVDSTFLPLFLQSLGASNVTIGMVPTLYFLGCSLFPILSGILTSRTPYKKRAVLLSHLFPPLVLIVLGFLLLATGEGSKNVIAVFLAGYGLFSAGIGFLLPVWQNYLVTIFTPKKSVSALSVMMIAQSAAKLTSSFLILEFVRRYAFSIRASSVLFTVTGLLFFLGSFFFILTKEVVHSETPGENIQKSPLRSLLLVLRNRNFLLFLGNELESFAITGILAFYATYATGFCGIAPQTAAGLFIAFSYAGAITVNILLGWLCLLSIKQKCLLSKAFSLLSVLVLITARSPAAFFLVSALLGSSRAVRWLIYAPAIKQISGKRDATVYFSLAPVLTLPLSAGIPLLNGKLLDYFSGFGAGAYKLVFGLQALIILAALFTNLKTNFDGIKEDRAAMGMESHPGQPSV